jgi:hypothetical protein
MHCDSAAQPEGKQLRVWTRLVDAQGLPQAPDIHGEQNPQNCAPTIKGTAVRKNKITKALI